MIRTLIMIRLLLFLVVSVLSALSPKIALAHTGGPPYVTINGQYANTNPLLNAASPTEFPAGSDIASQSAFLAGEPLEFGIDTKFFPNPYGQAQSPFGLPVTNQKSAPEPEFQWDFADGGKKAVGNPVTHTYTKPGTYILNLSVRYPGKTESFEPVNTVQLSVIPKVGYALPMGRITINGMEVKDPLRDTVSIKPVKPISFDARGSTGSIVSYEWDFGDETNASGKTATHRYAREAYFPTVVLRVTDSNGLYADTYALLDLPFERPNPILSLYYKVTDFFLGLLYRE